MRFINQGYIHASLAGVIVALAIPAGEQVASRPSSLQRLEQAIDPWVSFAMVPIFALANAGVRFTRLERADVIGSLPLGIGLGLFPGKQLGNSAPIWTAVRPGLAPKPAGASWIQIYGHSLLCGIGFTMSLFIGGRAFAVSDPGVGTIRIDILGGSLMAATSGSLILIRTLPPNDARAPY